MANPEHGRAGGNEIKIEVVGTKPRMSQTRNPENKLGLE